FLAGGTRPDILYSVSFFSRFCSGFTATHWTGLQDLLKYVKLSKGLKLFFARNNPEVQVIGYSDSDYAGDVVKRRSTLGGIALFGKHPISWWSKLLGFQVLSSTEAEYGALSYCVKETEFVQELIEDLQQEDDHEDKKLVKIFVDNQSAICIASGPTRRSK